MEEQVKNYIFDLYGTLMDIHTNEKKASLWKVMSGMYSVYGSDGKWIEFRKKFFLLDAEERVLLSEKTGVKHPEIKLERVFVRLLFEMPGSHPCAAKINGRDMDELRAAYKMDSEKAIGELSSSEFIYDISNLFRVASRTVLSPYPNTVDLLSRLRKNGKRVYLLSNAQRIFTYPELEATGLLPYFDRVYISSDYGMMKPEKAFLENLIKDEALDPSECVMVGNEMRSDMLMALSCGVKGIYINSAHHTKKAIDTELSEMIKEHGFDKAMGKLIRVVESGDIGETYR